jgi:hypothetical protein
MKSKEIQMIKTKEQYVKEVKEQINQLIAENIVPQIVGSFSELHDYVDANIECYSTIFEDYKCFTKKGNFVKCSEQEHEKRMTEATEMANAVADAVDEWIRDGRK